MGGVEALEGIEAEEDQSMRISNLFDVLVSAGAAAQASDFELAAVAGLVLGRIIPQEVEGPEKEKEAVLGFYQDGVDHWNAQDGLLAAEEGLDDTAEANSTPPLA